MMRECVDSARAVVEAAFPVSESLVDALIINGCYFVVRKDEGVHLEHHHKTLPCRRLLWDSLLCLGHNFPWYLQQYGAHAFRLKTYRHPLIAAAHARWLYGGRLWLPYDYAGGSLGTATIWSHLLENEFWPNHFGFEAGIILRDRCLKDGLEVTLSWRGKRSKPGWGLIAAERLTMRAFYHRMEREPWRYPASLLKMKEIIEWKKVPFVEVA